MSKFQIRFFKTDLTPTEAINVSGWFGPALGTESPIEIRGIIISENSSHHIVAAIDYCYMVGRSQCRFEEALAQAAGIPASRVVLQSNHVHDAPVHAEEAHQIIEEFAPGSGLFDERYFQAAVLASQEAIKQALTQHGSDLTSISFNEHRVEQFAATRRCIDENNRAHIRWAKGIADGTWLKDYPEGRIDPMLSQITFFSTGNKPLACLNFYACHPQVSNGRLTWSADTVGIARELFEQTHPDVFPIYFTGCAGDVTAGKYTTDSKLRDRLVFGTRLFDAMHGAFKAARPEPLESIGWTNRVTDVPLSSIPEDKAVFEKALKEPNLRLGRKYLAALKLHRIRQNIHTYPFRVSLLRLNSYAALFLPSELIVDYQLYAKEIFKAPLAVAAYGDSFLNYVAIDASFAQGGYETKPEWTEVEPGIEGAIKHNIAAVLG
jgi:hypothetical protein